MFKKIQALLLITFVLTGCETANGFLTPAEKASGYTYIPVDPFRVNIVPGKNCPAPPNIDEIIQNLRHRSNDDSGDIHIRAENEYYKRMIDYENSLYDDDNTEMLKKFPDNTVRISVEQIDIKGNITYGPASITAKNDSYRITMDYVNSDTTNLKIKISKYAAKIVRAGEYAKYEPVDIFTPLPDGYDRRSVNYKVKASDSDAYTLRETNDEFTEINIPVYVGIGLRVTANVKVNDSKVNLSGLGAIGADAEVNKLNGNLIIQTLGVNGSAIASALPIQSELNRTTVGNAMVAVGAIKALLYDQKTIISPRIVGIYLPFPGDEALVNSIISLIATNNSVQWVMPCKKPSKST